MSSTHVILIRHGQSQGNAEGRFGGHTDTPVSPLGRRQAEATAKALSPEKFNAIYSSDLRRAIETATPLAELTGAPLIPTDALRERSVGVMEGLTFAESAAQHPEQYQALLRRDFDHVLLGGESYWQMLDRSAAKLDRRSDSKTPRRSDSIVHAHRDHLHSHTPSHGSARWAGAKACVGCHSKLRTREI